MKYTEMIPNLNLEQIAQSGQCFRMTPLFKGPGGPVRYQVISRGRLALMGQEGQRLSLECPRGDRDFWLGYLDCGTDYGKILASADPEDAYLREAARLGSGIRILRQDPWEMIITFVISQQKTIPHIRALTESLSSRWGQAIQGPEGIQYAFPTPIQLSQASLEQLLSLKLGYRAKYIHRLSQDAAQGRLDLKALEGMGYQEAMDYLMGFYGIGKKVANCICLFGLHHIEAFPVDTWIEKILMREYYDEEKYKDVPKTRMYERIIQEHFGQYEGYAGVMQQYIFYYERFKSNKLA